MWGNHTFPPGKIYIEKNIKKRYVLTQSIEKSFLIDPLNTMQCTVFFYRQHFYKQHRAKIGKKLSKRQTCFWQTYQSRFACVIEKIDHMLYLIDVKMKMILEW